jgi:glycosyltransferase involved in cell wall biosynthesis
MRIAIVCGHFIPSLGYIEVHLARAFVQLGHKVSVITSDEIPSYVSHLESDLKSAPPGIEVIRLSPFFSLGQIVVAKGVREAVLATKPDRVLVIGLGKQFPKPALGTGVPTTVLFGDNSASYGDSPSPRTRILFELFKRKTYEKAIKKANRLVAYTPESFEAAGKILGGKWKEILSKEKNFISLGFHSDEFFFDESIRQSERESFGFTKDDIVIITATRLRPEKKLESVLPAFEKASKNVKWLVVGASSDKYSESFSNLVNEKLGSARFRILQHQSREHLNALYNAADMALFTTPAISIIEAMGSGLFVLLPRCGSLEHLIVSDTQGLYYDLNTLIIPENLTPDKSHLADINHAKLNWKNQAEALLRDG